MRSGRFLLSVLVCASALSASAAEPAPSTRQGPRVLRAAEHGVGRLVPDVAFTDLDDRPGRFSDFRSSRLLVIAFTSTSMA